MLFLATGQLQGEGVYRNRMSEIGISPGSSGLCNDSWGLTLALRKCQTLGNVPENIPGSGWCMSARDAPLLPRNDGSTGWVP